MNKKACKNCARWTNPLKTSACSYEYDKELKQCKFKENDNFGFYCDDFKKKINQESK